MNEQKYDSTNELGTEIDKPELAEWMRFISAVDSKENPAGLLSEKAWGRIADGLCPIDAFCLQELELLAKKMEGIEKELQTMGAQKKLLEKSPGSAANLYGEAVKDPFIEGLASKKRK